MAKKTATTGTKAPKATPKFTLTVNGGTGNGSYAAGTTVTIKANPAPTGQVFSAWTGNVLFVADVTKESTTVTMSANDATITATYKAVVPNPMPTATAVTPSSIPSGSPDTLVTLTGTNFVAGSKVRIGLTDLATTYVNATTLKATVSSARLANAVNIGLTVFNPTPGGGTSAPVNLTVTAPKRDLGWTPILIGLGVVGVIGAALLFGFLMARGPAAPKPTTATVAAAITQTVAPVLTSTPAARPTSTLPALTATPKPATATPPRGLAPTATATPTLAPTEAPQTTATPAATLAPSETPVATLAIATTIVPAVQSTSTMVSLNYDNGTPDCGNPANNLRDPLVIGQETYIAYYLCQAIQTGTEQAMSGAVAAIQKMAATVGATVWEGTSVTIPEMQAAFVWCSNTTGAVLPNDTAFPLGQEKSTALEYDSPNGFGNVFILPPIGGGTTGRTFSGCENGNGAYWAVAVY